MKKYLLIMVAFMTTISLFAQQQDSTAAAAPHPLYGTVSYEKAMQSMAEYQQMEQSLANQKSQYEAELQKAADEFNAKYETFLTEQKSYAPSILRKRQSELEDLVKRNEQFKNDSKKNLDYARKTLLQPIKEKLNTVISQVAQEQGLQFVLNSDNNNVPYTNSATTVDITSQVISAIAK